VGFLSKKMTILKKTKKPIKDRRKYAKKKKEEKKNIARLKKVVS